MENDAKDNKKEVCFGIYIQPYTKVSAAGITYKDYAIINKFENQVINR